jgi:hypothetical protein
MHFQGCLLPWYGSNGLRKFFFSILSASFSSTRTPAQYAQPLLFDLTIDNLGVTSLLHFIHRHFQGVPELLNGSKGLSPDAFIISIASESLVLIANPTFLRAHTRQPPPDLTDE